MNAQKVLSIRFLLVITFLIVLGSSWQPAAAHSGIYRLLEGQTIDLGKQGLHATNIPVGVSSVYLDTVAGKTLPPRFDHKLDIDYRSPVLEVRFLNANQGTVEQISAQVYVFFNIGKAERALWLKSGMEQIAIWFANETTGSWEMCRTMFVNENRDNGTYDRLACVAGGSGYYVLGQGDFNEELFNPYTVQNQRVVSYVRKYSAE